MAFQIAGYDDLQARISRRFGGSSDTGFTDAVQEAIYAAESEMNLQLRVPEMDVRSKEEVNEPWETLPPDLLDLRAAFYVVDNNDEAQDRPLRKTSTERLGHYSEIGRGPPCYYGLHGLEYRVEPRATTETYYVRLHYRGKVPSLSEDSPSTVILDKYPLIYLYGALSNLDDWAVNDPRIERWRTRFYGLMTIANDLHDSRAGGHAR